MASTRYDVGDVATITGTFTKKDGSAQDPGTLQFVYKLPSGTETTLTYPADAALVKDATGVYHVDVSVAEAGTWRYRWVATGVGQTAEPGFFEAFANPLENERTARALERLKRMVASAEEPVLDDDELADLLRLAQRPDSTGLLPSEVGWTPTYDLNAAAAEGWLWKAGKASPNYSFGIDAEQNAQSDVFKHCMKMHETYTSGGSGSAKALSMIDDFDISVLDTLDPFLP